MFGKMKLMREKLLHTNVHFICRGNVLRSLIAETYLRSLNLDNVSVMSSGTNVNWSDETERQYFANTLAVLDSHGIKSYVKPMSDQLSQERANNKDITVCMNQRVLDEALAIVELPKNVINWEIVDIGEGTRTNRAHREVYEEEIYREITTQVDELVKKMPTNKKIPSKNT